MATTLEQQVNEVIASSNIRQTEGYRRWRATSRTSGWSAGCSVLVSLIIITVILLIMDRDLFKVRNYKQGECQLRHAMICVDSGRFSHWKIRWSVFLKTSNVSDIPVTFSERAPGFIFTTKARASNAIDLRQVNKTYPCFYDSTKSPYSYESNSEKVKWKKPTFNTLIYGGIIFLTVFSLALFCILCSHLNRKPDI